MNEAIKPYTMQRVTPLQTPTLQPNTLWQPHSAKHTLPTTAHFDPEPCFMSNKKSSHSLSRMLSRMLW